MSIAEGLQSPMMLHPYLPTEEVRARYENSLTLCDVLGRTGDDMTAYNVRITKLTAKRYSVSWAMYLKICNAGRTVQDYAWTKNQITFHGTESAAVKKARGLIADFRRVVKQ